jgi:hypothetical protein
MSNEWRFEENISIMTQWRIYQQNTTPCPKTVFDIHGAETNLPIPQAKTPNQACPALIFYKHW